ncbi:MAG: YaiI/YqxD family protein [Pseudomonadota bacterium]
MIYVDADACPVRIEVLRVAERHGTPVAIVSNGGIRPSQHPLVTDVFVDAGADAADKWIADRCGAGDVVVTADIPLAARCVDAGARVLKPDGSTLAAHNVKEALAMRDLMTDMRAANPLGAGGGGRTFSRADRSRFLDMLDRELRRAGAA